MPEMDRLVIVKTLRPDRLTAALSRFVAATIGKQYITSVSFSLERSFQVFSTLFPRTVLVKRGFSLKHIHTNLNFTE